MRSRSQTAALLLMMAAPGLVAVEGRAQERASDQGLPRTVVSLSSLDDFRPVSENWTVAGGLEIPTDQPGTLHPLPGASMLVNVPTREARGNLFTDWEHGDLELEIEFLVPQGSNSGIYLQGRYEIQILDSWGVVHPKFSDCGAIYQRWDDSRAEGARGYEGRPPRTNVSRAPGLWQQYRILFEAPRFNEEGEKTQNARFVRVEHNGVVVHENVEVTGPTRAAAFKDEKPIGPLMIQGDHGPVAFRNIRYKRFGAEHVELSGLTYSVYDGTFDELVDLSAGTPAASGALDVLTGELSANRDTFAVQIDGDIRVPTAGLHRFDLGLNWITGDPHFQNRKTAGAELLIGGRRALSHDGRTREQHGLIDLPAGTHTFSLRYFKNRFWSAPRIALHVEGPDTPRSLLSLPPDPPSVAPIVMVPVDAPLLLRGFVLDDEGRKRTHTISVGHPEGVHYSYDLAQGAVIRAWRGGFVDATSMWHGRGSDQLAVPVGSMLPLSAKPPITTLSAPDEPMGDAGGAPELEYLGYALDEAGLPTFRYESDGLQIEDRLEPGGGGLKRTVTLHSTRAPSDLWLRVVAAAEIAALGSGRYSIGDRTYYAEVPPGVAEVATIRPADGGYELVVPFSFRDGEATLAYSIVW